MHRQEPPPNLPQRPCSSLLGTSIREGFLLCALHAAPATLQPCVLYLHTLPGACLCRFSHPRWPKLLLPALISGRQSPPKTPTRHAPYEWLIQILIVVARCPVRFPLQLNAPFLLLLVLAGGAVAFSSRPQSVGSG